MKNIVLGLCIITLLYSTTITGGIVNGDSLEKMNNVLITVENANGGIIVQKLFSAEYSLEISPGSYILRAYHYYNGTVDYYNDYDIQVTSETMNLDIVLLPYELVQLTPDKTPPPLTNQTSINQDIIPQITIDYGLAFAAIIIAVVTISFFYFKRKKPDKKEAVEETVQEPKHELDEDCERAMQIMKENEGRMVQKELREIMNFSETKMSLVVAELEACSMIKRIKKGRENILKLVKQ
jgi:uncharacterized membrane protein